MLPPPHRSCDASLSLIIKSGSCWEPLSLSMNQYGAPMSTPPGQFGMGQQMGQEMGQMQMAPMPQQRFANPAGSCINPEHVR